MNIKYYLSRAKLFVWILISVVLWCGPIPIEAKRIPSIFDMQQMKKIISHPQQYDGITSLLHSADSLTELSPLTVTDKKHTYAPDKNYFCSLCRYYWPNPNNPNGPYILKDGITNPEFYQYDGQKIIELAKRLQYLSVAYCITNDERYSISISELIKTWFLNPETRMYPNFEYCQVAKGHNGNKGMTYGMSDLQYFVKIIESLMLLEANAKIDGDLIIGLKGWFGDFRKWVLGSQQWKVQSESINNITSTCYLSMMEICLFLDDRKTADTIARSFKQKVIDKQIDDDGKQPAELSRTIGFGYSVGNLDIIIDFCLVSENLGINLYRQNQKKIDAAFAYLYQYVGNHDAFPYQQIASWEVSENTLIKNMKRLSRLNGRPSRIRRMSTGIKLKENSAMEILYK